MNRGSERATTEPSYELLGALQNTLVGTCLTTLCAHLPRFATTLRLLPPDLVQCVVDALAARHALHSEALATLVAAGVADTVDRIALRLGEPMAMPSVTVFESLSALEEYVSSERRSSASLADSPFGELQAVSLAMTLVGDAWLAPLCHFTALTELELASCYHVTDEPLAAALGCLPLLRTLDLDRCKRVSDAGVAPVAEGRLPRLQALGLGGTRTHAVFHALAARTPALRALDACGTTLGDWQLATLCGRDRDALPGGPPPPPALRLERLGLAKTAITDGAPLAALAPTLASLDLSFNPGVRRAEPFLRRLPLLRVLDLSLNHWVDDAALAALCDAAPRLERLNVEKTEVTDAGAAHLVRLVALRRLDLSRTGICGGAGGAGWAWLPSLQALETLFLPYCDVDARLVPALPPSLRHLKLSRALRIDDAAVGALAQRAAAGELRLHALDIGSAALTDACLLALCALVEAGLGALTLWHTKVTRGGIVMLMAATGVIGLDTSMSCSDGTYLMRRVPPA